MMGIVKDFLQVVFACISKFFTDGISFSDTEALVHKLALLLGIVLTSVFLGWATYRSSTLWNKKVTDIPAYRWLAGLSFVLSLLFAISFFSLGYLREVAIDYTGEWNQKLQKNKDWGNKTFSKAYYNLKQVGEEDFTDYPPPEADGHVIPLNYESSRRTLAKIYVNEAIAHFKSTHPYLGLILNTSLDIPEEKIYQDNVRFFKENPGQSYSLANAIRIASDELKAGYDLRIPPLIDTTRMSLLIICSGIMAVFFWQSASLPIVTSKHSVN